MDKAREIAERVPRGASEFTFFDGFNTFNSQAMRFFTWPVEMWLQWEAELLRAAQPAASDWLTRRREGVESALAALERLCAAERAEEATRIQSEWFEDERKRLDADWRALAAPALIWPKPPAPAMQRAPRTKAPQR
jgi:hypothetical protein